MAGISRRSFLDRTKSSALAAAAGMTVLKTAGSARGTPANDRIVLGVAGLGGRGSMLARDFLARPENDCAIGWACDPDRNRAEMHAAALAERQGRPVEVAQDVRRVLEDSAVDALVVATPDHWHALATIWACQAGKDVYVEKPACHSAWEGQKMVEAARKYNRIVQLGTQSRSAPYLMKAKQLIDAGGLGRIHFCRVVNMKHWGNFPLEADSQPPAGLDWDLWNGPAPEHPYNRTFQRNWHHLWRYSGGDIANDASHQIDIARWLCGVTLPAAVHSTGGRYNSSGGAETPDAQVCTWRFDDLLMVFELTLYTPYMLKTDPEVRNSDLIPYWPQNATRVELYGERGLMFVGRHGGGWEVYIRPENRQPVRTAWMAGRFPDPEHKENFLACMRSRTLPTADILEGHRSALLIHYGNISYRLGGEQLTIDREKETIVGNDRAMALFRREYRAPYVVPDTV